MDINFPRQRDNEPFAWGLTGSQPAEIWERFSPTYETQLERLVVILKDLGFRPSIGGAGSEDGEYIRAEFSTDSRKAFFQHLEEPVEAKFIDALSDEALREWILTSVGIKERPGSPRI